MKKYLFLLILIMIAPMFVLADSASPSIIGFDAIITNKNGAKSINEEGTIIPYNTKIRVINDHGNGDYSVCIQEDTDKNDINQCLKSPLDIKGSDMMILKDEVLPKDVEKISNDGTSLAKEKLKIVISNSNGVKVKKGPADLYSEIGNTIPYKTSIEVNYYLKGYEGDHDFISWVYVDSNGNRGWINSDNYNIVYANEKRLLFHDIDLYDDSGNIVVTLKKEEVVSGFTSGNLYNYQGQYLILKDECFDYLGYSSEKGYILTTKSINILSGEGKAISGIPSKTKVKILYAEREFVEVFEPYPVCIKDNECYYYVEYNGQKGFISSTDVIPLKHESKVEQKSFSGAKELYALTVNKYSEQPKSVKEHLNKNKLNIIIPGNTKITCYSTDYLYSANSEMVELTLVNYNDTLGWIVTNSEGVTIETPKSTDEKEETPAETPKSTEEEKPTETPNPTEEKPIETAQPENNKEYNKSENTILYLIIAALIIGIAALATILIINQNKDAKKVEKSKENVVPKKTKEEKKTEEKQVDNEKKEV